MSWQVYVDDHLLYQTEEGNQLTSAAILGHDGSVWAQSPNFPQFKPEEITAIINDFDQPGSLAPTGLYLGGTKYMVIQGEPGAVIRGKKVKSGSKVVANSGLGSTLLLNIANILVVKTIKGSGGITVKKTTAALLIGIYDEPMTPGQCNIIVEKLGDYLIEQGI